MEERIMVRVVNGFPLSQMTSKYKQKNGQVSFQLPMELSASELLRIVILAIMLVILMPEII